MKSQTNLTLAKLRKLLLVTALVICPFLAFQTGNAQTTNATLTSGGANFINILAGQTFQLTLAITTSYETGGYTVFYTVNPAGSGFFSLIARTNNQPIFNDPTSPDGVALTPVNGLLDPTNNTDLGYTGDQVTNAPAGTFALQTLTVSVNASLAPGTYTIFLDPRSIMTDRTGGGFVDRNMNLLNSFTITVIPEPTTVGLAILGGAALLVVARRKLRNRV